MRISVDNCPERRFMETDEQKGARVSRALIKISAILEEEHCELEPFVLITNGNLIKKEINVVAKPLPEQSAPVVPAPAQPEGGTN
jgi:hypothetical protein